MKFLVFGTCLCFFTTSLAQPAPGEASLVFLDPLVAQAEAQDESLAVARAVEKEQDAAVASARAGYLPSLSLNAQTGPSKTWQWNQDGRVGQGQGATWSNQAGVSARQNLWSGGVTALREETATVRREAGRLDTQKRRANVTIDLARDLVDLVTFSRSLALQAKLLEQARALETIAVRKNKSGFLGKKELLETEREALRSELSLGGTRLEFQERLARFNRTYRQTSVPLSVSRLAELAVPLETASKTGGALVGTPALEQAAFEQSLDLRGQEISISAAESEAQIAHRQRHAPSLDLSAGLSGSLVDNRNIPAPGRSLAADSQLTASATLGFTMSLFAPEARAAADAAVARKETSLVRKAQAERLVRDALDSYRSQRLLLERQLADQRRLLAASEDLRDKNTRLFEAGAFDVITVVNSQQDVARQRQSELDVRARLEKLGVEALGAAQLGVIPGSSSGSAP